MKAVILKQLRFICPVLAGVLFGLSTDAYGSTAVPPREWVRAYSRDAAQTNMALKVEIGTDNKAVVAGSSQNSTNNLDYLVFKYQPNGTVAWQYRYDTGGHDETRAMSGDGETNVFITGTSKTLKITADGNRAWEASFSGRDVVYASSFVYVVGFSDVDASIAKISREGAVQWIRTTNGYISHKVILDTAGGVYAGGKLITCGPGGCIERAIALSYSATGAFGWRGEAAAARIGLESAVKAMTLDSQGNILMLYNSDPRNFGVVGFSPKGDYIFPDYGVDGIGIRPYGYGQALAVSVAGDIFAGGRVSENFEHFNTKITLGKFNSDGIAVWQSDYPNAFFGLNESLALALDGTNFVYTAGYLTNATSGRDFTVIKYSQSGEILWVDTYDGSAHKNDVATSVAVDKNGNVYATGYSETVQGGTEFVTIKYSAAPTIQSKTDGSMHLEFHTSPGQQYAIEATTDFFNWQSLITNTADANGLIQHDDTAAPTIPYRFYRGKTVE